MSADRMGRCKKCHVEGAVHPEEQSWRCPDCGYTNLTRNAMRRYEALRMIVDVPVVVSDTPAASARATDAFDPSSEGRKKGKVRVELVLEGMPNAIMALGQIMTWALEGKGYKEGDFLHVPDAAQKYRGGMLRHDLKEMMGHETDEESGYLHAAHTAWNALARLEIKLREQKQNDLQRAE